MYKRALALLPPGLRQRIRDLTEFQGGAMDTAFMRATSEETVFDKRARHRKPPASNPAVRMPSGPHAKHYDIGYYHRDPRNLLNRTKQITLEDDTLIRAAKLDQQPIDVQLAALKGHLSGEAKLTHPNLVDTIPDDDMFYEGSPGRRDPDVNRYSKDGLRSAMTTSWSATDKALHKIKPDHLDDPVWMRSRAAAIDVIETSKRKSELLGADVTPTPYKPRFRTLTGVNWQYYDRIV